MGYIYKSNGGRTTETRHAGKQEDTPPKKEVPYQITLIRLRQWQGSLDRRWREKVIRKMFTEDDCYPFTLYGLGR